MWRPFKSAIIACPDQRRLSKDFALGTQNTPKKLISSIAYLCRGNWCSITLHWKKCQLWWQDVQGSASHGHRFKILPFKIRESWQTRRGCSAIIRVSKWRKHTVNTWSTRTDKWYVSIWLRDLIRFAIWAFPMSERGPVYNSDTKLRPRSVKICNISWSISMIFQSSKLFDLISKSLHKRLLLVVLTNQLIIDIKTWIHFG